VAFSPDGKTLASGRADQTVQLWGVADPRHPQPLGGPLTGHTNTVYSVAFSPDGKTLASGSWDQTVRLWDVADPRHPQPLSVPFTGHTDPVWSVAFSPDGKTLASGGGDNAIRLWDVSVTSWEDRACAIAGRNLTADEWQLYMSDAGTPFQQYQRVCPALPPGDGAPANAPSLSP
jgi:WD40 repeat protein